MASIIPMRPANLVSSLNQMEQTCLTWLVLSGCNRKDAFLAFCRPDMYGSKAKAAVDDFIKQFFARKEVKEYIEAYKNTIDEFLHPSKSKEVPTASLEERKARARAKALDFAIELAEDIKQASDPEFVVKLLDKVGILDVEEADELPRRYLPVSPCQTGCAYRIFCEDNTEDMCPFCKYYRFGEENGVHYDKTEMLDVPIKVAEAEE